MKLSIYKIPEDKDTYIWYVEIKQRYAELWYNEISRRHSELFKDKELWSEYKEIYDIDESYELWQISVQHLASMMKFLQYNIRNIWK